jgi:heterodisulfide reductase subunit A-like polyferredoxin
MSEEKKNGSVGAALVVGGGIAGIQASLDLAEAGIKVYLVEKSPAIGGKMAQLDKTFPTNDCAMCIISPKLTSCGRHPNIEILTNSTVKSLSGEPGHFKVKVSTAPRYVDIDKCTACNLCAEACPVKLPNEFNAGLGERRAIYKLYPQAVPNAYGITKKGIAPCKANCPAGISVQGYVALIAEGRPLDALRVIKDRMPFAAACGRICNHLCEDNCNRGLLDEPVSIMRLKRYASDYAYRTQAPLPEPVPKTREERVAIVGAGPAGLTAAKDLALLGYPVTVFEALPVAGGMLVYGIPKFRLPRELVQRDVDEICALGIDLRLNTALGRDFTIEKLLAEGYKAIFLAIGAHASHKMRVEGEDTPGVVGAVEFLRQVELGERSSVGERVAVVGGGNTAMDAARTALRLGAREVTIVYRRSRQEMPANAEEVHEAEAEGVNLMLLAAPVKVVGGEDGWVKGLVCQKMELGEPDSSGRRRPLPIAGSEFTLPADLVIAAIGQGPGRTGLPEGLALSRGGTLEADPETLATNLPGVFAGGDAVTGTTFVVQAVAAGHKAAQSIHRYLRGAALLQPEEKPQIVRMEAAELQERAWRGELSKGQRPQMPVLPVDQRLASFEEVELGYSEEAAVAEAQRCLNCGICSECYECVRVCGPGALIHDDKGQERELEVGAVILATGYETYDARLSEEFGYGRYPNVVTALQMERLLSASGPTEGHLVRPSDHQEPRKIAFLQCVGSRDQNHSYCSAVCCMYATKEAMLAQEHVPGVECTIFQMDMRAFGKGFDAYFERGRKQGIRYVRCRPSSLKEAPTSRNIIIRYQTEEGQIREEEFDLVVLSVGLEPSPSGQELARSLGVDLDSRGFCATQPFKPLETNRPGVFVCGTFTEPKDIPDTVVQASGAAAGALRLIGRSRGTEVEEKVYPAENPLDGAEPRIGVFICHCGSNIAGVIDVKAVAEYAKTLDNVVHAETILYTCSADSLNGLPHKIAEFGLNRVVVASCSPRTHEPLFQETLREAGLNPYLFEMANIRDQCSWVHASDHEAATEKAKDLVRMAVGRARFLEPLHKMSLDLNRRALVVGGGVAGMTAALSLAEQGFPVFLVEREKELGSRLRGLHSTVEGADPRELLRSLEERLRSHDLIEVLTGMQVVKYGGFVGNYKTTLAAVDDPTQRLIEHGVTILATGGQEYRGPEYLLGQHPRVITQGDLEAKLAGPSPELQTARDIVMIQCVGPWENQEFYCSRICCSLAMKNALALKKLNPKARIHVLFKEMRTYGFKEELYTQAREAGVLMVRYSDERPPQLTSQGEHLKLSFWEPAFQEEMSLEPDLVVLSEAVVPSEGLVELASEVKVPLSREGFLLEAHIKLRPVDFASEGIFLAGTAQYPKFIDESIAQASAAAARATTILTQKQLMVGGAVAQVEAEKCAACLTCVRVCPFQVPYINEQGVAQIEVAMCQGCGICAAECPAKAIQLLHYRDEQVMAKSDALLAGVK